jgi:hypothetical protein
LSSVIAAAFPSPSCRDGYLPADYLPADQVMRPTAFPAYGLGGRRERSLAVNFSCLAGSSMRLPAPVSLILIVALPAAENLRSPAATSTGWTLLANLHHM